MAPRAGPLQVERSGLVICSCQENTIILFASILVDRHVFKFYSLAFYVTH